MLVAIWSVFGLTGMHCFLVVANLTTNENIKGTFVSRAEVDYENSDHPRVMENPFSLGSPYHNCQSVMCSSRRSTLLRKVPH